MLSKIEAENYCVRPRTWPGVFADMKSAPESSDPAAVFACAVSLWEACHARAAAQRLNLSEAYNGIDELMREIMRVANDFETWACAHVKFDQLDDVWPYLLQDRFGVACVDTVMPTELKSFSDRDFFRVALRLRLTVVRSAQRKRRRKS